jgi:hypothetical protein
MKLTRRKLASVLVSATATAVAVQQPPPTPTPTPDDLQAARDRLQANARTLAATPVPMATEPAFQFKV